MASVRAFLGDAVIYGVGKAIKKFIGVFLLPFYARALSPEEYGIIDVLSNAVFFLTVFCTIGLDSASARFFFIAESEKEKGQVLFTSISIRLMLAGIVVLMLIPFAGLISYNLFETYDHKWAVITSCLLVPIGILSEDQSNIYRFYRKAIQFNVITILQSLINIGIGIVLVIQLNKSVFGFNLATLLSSFTIITASFLIFTSKKYTFKFDTKLAKKMLQYGFPLIGAGILGWVLSASDRYFLLYYKDLKEIGLFSIGNTFSQPIQLINTAVLMSQGILIMSTYQSETDDNKPKTKALANRILQIYLILSVPIILGLSIFGTYLIDLITTPEYLLGALVIPYMGFSSLFSVLYVLTGYGMDLKLKTKYYFWMMLVSALVNVGLNFYFIPNFGFLGAAITTLMCNFLYFAMAYYYSQKFFYIERNLTLILSYLAIAFLIAEIVPVLEIQFNYNVHFGYKVLLFILSLTVPFLIRIVSLADLAKFKQMFKEFPNKK